MVSWDALERGPTFRTSAERLELVKAFESNSDLSRARLVVKLTDKYVLPDLEAELSKLTLNNASAVLQAPNSIVNRLGPDSTNCELYGFSPQVFSEFLKGIPLDLRSLPNNDGLMEMIVGMFALNRSETKFLPTMIIPVGMRVPRSNGDVLPEVV